MVISKTFSFLSSLSFHHKISLNKFASQKQALVVLTWFNVSAAMALLTTLLSFLELHIIGEELSPTI